MKDIAQQRREGSPFDRGNCDHYYGRPYDPYKYNYTGKQIEEYQEGWDDCVNPKDWGDENVTPEQE